VPSAELKEQMADLQTQWPDVPWDTPEKYVWMLGSIPQVSARLSAWAFLWSFREHADSVVKSLLALEEGCEVLESTVLKRLLTILLAVGNVLNEGTQHEAEGFAIESLEKFAEVKADRGKSLLQYALAVLEEEEEGAIEDLLIELDPCETCTEAWENVSELTSKLAADAKSTRVAFDALSKSGDMQHLEKLMKATEAGARELWKRSEACAELYANTRAFFCCKDVKQPTEAFFAQWRSWLQQIRAARDGVADLVQRKRQQLSSIL